MTATDPTPLPGRPPEWSPIPGPGPVQPNEPPRRLPGLPMVLPPTHDPRAYDPQDRLLQQRIVLLTGLLDQPAADDVNARLLWLDTQGREPIQLWMSCPDAQLDAALSVVATIDVIQPDVHAVATGTVVGVAVAVYAAAAKRRAHPHATFVLREPRTESSGDAEHLAVEAAQRQHERDAIRDRIARVTGRSTEAVGVDLRDGRWLTAEQAVGYGLVETLAS